MNLLAYGTRLHNSAKYALDLSDIRVSYLCALCVSPEEYFIWKLDMLQWCIYIQ